jgi:tRNA uridine 5-carboxymethylaminomethyl modification enzyme
MLNRSKGPAVWVAHCDHGADVKGPRAQIDRKLYKKYMREELNVVENLTLVEGSVSDLLIGAPDSESGKQTQFGKMQGIWLGYFLLAYCC